LPRKPPSEVVEHRFSLSNLERDQLKKFVLAQQIKSGAGILPGVGIIAIGGGCIYAAWALSKWVGVSILDDLKESFSETWDFATTGTNKTLQGLENAVDAAYAIRTERYEGTRRIITTEQGARNCSGFVKPDDAARCKQLMNAYTRNEEKFEKDTEKYNELKRKANFGKSVLPWV